MKKIKILLLSSLTFFCVYSVKSQTSVGGGLGIFKPNDFESLIGPSFFFKKTFNEKIGVGLNLGYYFKSEDGVTISFTPIAASVDYSLSTNKFSPYLGMDLGLYRAAVSFDGASESQSKIGLAPTVGFNFELSDKLALNSNFKYHYILTEGEATKAIGINVGIAYKIK